MQEYDEYTGQKKLVFLHVYAVQPSLVCFASYAKGVTVINFKIIIHQTSETAHHRCSYEKLFWKYAANLQKKTHVLV